MSKRRIAPPYDLSAPPAGVRLNVGTVAAALHTSLQEMADAAGVSKTSMFEIVTQNRWPVRASNEPMRLAVQTLLAERGATEVQLATLWWAHGADHRGYGSGPQSQDYYGRAKSRPATPSNDEEDPDMQLMKQTLTPQAARHFKVLRNPFDGEVVRDEQFFCGPDIRFVREAAWACAQNGGFSAIVGESGAGKTTILAELESRLERDPQGVLLIKPSVLGLEVNNNKGQVLKSTDILHAIITALDANAVVPQTLQARTVRVRKMLAESSKAGTQHLLVIEEAHSLPDATLKHLKRLHELREGRRNLLGILLLAQPELKVRLAAGLRSGSLREVAQRCEIVDLLPLDGELKDYLRTRAEAAAMKLEQLVDDQGVEALRARLTRRTQTCAVSMCYPLVVNNMVTRALNSAAELGVPVVTADVVKAL